MTAGKVYFLSKVELFAHLSPQDLAELARDFEWAKFDKYSDIVPQGEKNFKFYVLAEGKAEVLINNQQDPLKVNSFGPGDIFGEISLFTGNPPPVTIRCTENCKVLVMNRDNFARMLTRWPKLYEKFLEKLSHHLMQANMSMWETRYKELLRAGLLANQLQYKFYGLWGSRKTTREVESKLAEFSRNGGNLLVLGERGTGRQMFAWYLHKQQFGESAPFIVIDGVHFDRYWGEILYHKAKEGNQCPKITIDSLLDIVKGGTLFIRDINMISARNQVQLARAIRRTETACRIIGSINVGSDQIPTDLATPLTKCFDLRYEITPLRERKRDIPVIAQGILNKLAQQNNRKTPVLDPQANKLLLSHDFRQGNVTELIQVIERAFLLADDEIIGLEHLFFGQTPKKLDESIDLLTWAWVKKLIINKKFPVQIQKVSFLFFSFITFCLIWGPKTKLTGILSSIIWGLWWPALAIFSPLFGRIWCCICPFSGLFELVQKYVHFNRTIPNFLKKYDYALVTFLFLLIVWVETVANIRSSPVYTGLLFICIMALAGIIGIIFVRHTWCRHLCPLGGFVGMASIGAMLEVRADPNICLSKCSTYECYRGKDNSPGCPVLRYAPFIDNNLDCKLCLRCIHNCPNGSAKLNLRFPGKEVWHLTRINQGYVIFIGTALAILVPMLYFQQLQKFLPFSTWQVAFTLSYWLTALISAVAIRLIARPFRNKTASRRIKLVFALVPMVLAGHIIYQLSYLPGITAVNLGVILEPPGSYGHMFTVPALTLLRFISAAIGITLTGFTITMVLVRTSKET
ncbi:GAF modulated Fis family sigma-54 specific transcriptional regulator [Thermincola ferriacetica]|uniref:GAF modulated Fis family sigma-54 specific transcriptional regulator n=1 Tax=Thermincola ferriacetica TaxID=281456 RepID=A0A0L6W181_9FIRM|nr:cyclic nucleotide-binding domain-containing protein [Thermincola ferriacetica]KNZ69231.1 GAF modulated Fis family sigma-54 specific transcriptional regulator [Thermincola ferriacetica]